MRSSTWARRLQAVPGRSLAGLAAALFVAAASPAFAQWRVIPEVRVTGGDEADLVIDPGLSRVVVPGGSFVEVMPGLSGGRWMGSDGLLNVGTFASIQHFFNAESRLLYAQTAWIDMYQGLGSSFRVRVSGALDFFDDSEREDAQRLGAGAEAGITYLRTRWNAGARAGVHGRRYPGITVTESGGMNSFSSFTYTETIWSGALSLRVAPIERLNLACEGVFQTTDALDPRYDSRSWTASGAIDARLKSSMFLTLSGAYQERAFTDRIAGEDTDSYGQLGVGLRYLVAPGWTALVRWGYSIYTWPDGSDEDTYRIAVGLHYSWGRRDAPPPPRMDVPAMVGGERGGSVQRPGTGGAVRFRLEAAGARQVSVVGSFNAWDPRATPLRTVEDGVWEAALEIDPGTYEYAYVVDGVWTTPPEARVTVEDGFGGRNGVLEVLGPDV
jgi:hypothetical protein